MSHRAFIVAALALTALGSISAADARPPSGINTYNCQETMEWQYKSRDPKTGKFVTIGIFRNTCRIGNYRRVI